MTATKGAEEEVMVADSGRVGFRDLYRAIGETEARLTQTILSAVGPFRKEIDDHEERIRAIELSGSKEAREAAVIAQQALSKAEAAAAVADFFKARETGVVSTLGAGQKVIITIAAVFGIISVVLNIFNIAIGH